MRLAVDDTLDQLVRVRLLLRKDMSRALKGIVTAANRVSARIPRANGLISHVEQRARLAGVRTHDVHPAPEDVEHLGEGSDTASVGHRELVALDVEFDTRSVLSLGS